MEIERVNENTLKFFITYVDMEARGFDREEIWYNRERGEDLFWEMMDEAHSEEEFPLEGPLWIQVQALEKGLEIIVTKAQLSKDGSKLELPISEDKQVDIPVDENIENMIEEQFSTKHGLEEKEQFAFHPEDDLQFIIGFNDFEDLVDLSHSFYSNNAATSIYHYEGHYYLHVSFNDDDEEEDNKLDDQISCLLEYGFESRLTEHRLEEYGKAIVEENGIETFRQYFPLK